MAALPVVFAAFGIGPKCRGLQNLSSSSTGGTSIRDGGCVCGALFQPRSSSNWNLHPD